MSSHHSLISTGNDELDSRLGGGLPHPSLTVIEGDNGTGKTTIALQFTYGALGQGRRVIYLTTESTVRQLLMQARNITFNLTPYYLRKSLEVYSAHTRPEEWTREWAQRILASLSRFLASKRGQVDLIVIDSLTPIASRLKASELALLFSVMRSVTRYGTSVLVTIHPGAVGEELMKVARAVADVYFKLGVVEVGGRPVKVLSVVKIRGAPTVTETAIAFDVDPAFGIKIVPIVLAHA